MENRAHAAEMAASEDADDITELVQDKKRLPRKMAKVKLNCGVGSIAWSFEGLQFITNSAHKWRRERWQLAARDGCAQPTGRVPRLQLCVFLSVTLCWGVR